MDQLPDGATVVEEGGKTYFQFDSVFMEQTDNGKYNVVGSPDGSETVELGADS